MNWASVISGAPLASCRSECVAMRSPRCTFFIENSPQRLRHEAIAELGDETDPGVNNTCYLAAKKFVNVEDKFREVMTADCDGGAAKTRFRMWECVGCNRAGSSIAGSSSSSSTSAGAGGGGDPPTPSGVPGWEQLAAPPAPPSAHPAPPQQLLSPPPPPPPPSPSPPQPSPPINIGGGDGDTYRYAQGDEDGNGDGDGDANANIYGGSVQVDAPPSASSPTDDSGGSQTGPSQGGGLKELVGYDRWGDTTKDTLSKLDWKPPADWIDRAPPALGLGAWLEWARPFQLPVLLVLLVCAVCCVRAACRCVIRRLLQCCGRGSGAATAHGTTTTPAARHGATPPAGKNARRFGKAKQLRDSEYPVVSFDDAAAFEEDHDSGGGGGGGGGGGAKQPSRVGGDVVGGIELTGGGGDAGGFDADFDANGFGADLDADGFGADFDANGFDGAAAAGSGRASGASDLIDLGLNDLLVDEPVGHVHAPVDGHTIKPPLRGQGCSYEELEAGVGSDCSADDFDVIFDQPPAMRPQGRSSVAGGMVGAAGRLTGRVPSCGSMMPLGRGASGRASLSGIGMRKTERSIPKEQRAVEKHSLLTDLDVLVS